MMRVVGQLVFAERGGRVVVLVAVVLVSVVGGTAKPNAATSGFALAPPIHHRKVVCQPLIG